VSVVAGDLYIALLKANVPHDLAMKAAEDVAMLRNGARAGSPDSSMISTRPFILSTPAELLIWISGINLILTMTILIVLLSR
jgi:hypothetical protein